MVESSLCDAEPQLAHSPLYPRLADFLSYVHQQTTPDWSPFIASFWPPFADVCRKCLNVGQRTSVARLSDLLQNFKRKRKEKKRISFLDSETAPDSSTPSECSTELLREDGECLRLVAELCSAAFRTARADMATAQISFLSRVLGTYKTPRLLAALLNDCGEDRQPNCRQFCDDILIPWIQDLARSEKGGEDDGLRGLLDLLVAVHAMASEDDKPQILLSVCEVSVSASICIRE